MEKRKNKTYLVIGYKSWNRDIFDRKISKYPVNWYFISRPKELTLKKLKRINPEKIFFLHWSWKVPKEIIDNFECICFHMTDVPYGRGGSPLQNLIIRGHKKTKLTALRMTDKFDTGPIYLKKSLSLEGRAEEIYKRGTSLEADMIFKIIKDNPRPKPQKGKVVIFKRRKPEESEILEIKNIEKLYDFIRMLDAEGYPKAFLKYKGFIFEFSNPKFSNNKILSEVKIEKDEPR